MGCIVTLMSLFPGRGCIVTLTPLDLHSDSLELLQTLAFDMRINCMALLLKQSIEGTEYAAIVTAARYQRI